MLVVTKKKNVPKQVWLSLVEESFHDVIRCKNNSYYWDRNRYVTASEGAMDTPINIGEALAKSPEYHQILEHNEVLHLYERHKFLNGSSFQTY